VTASLLRAGAATDCGPARLRNEDRLYLDEARGIFLVVDGVGGQQAGEKAAETAVQVIARELARAAQPSETALRHAITAANNEIRNLAEKSPQWRGMACVLTLAWIDGDSVLVGHVGDSRLYLAWNGNLRKITMDHSPVGEQEDMGELTEEQAMRHPGRNQIFRDLGAALHAPDDDGFIETHRVPFRSEAALLLCSDGLSDALASAQTSAVVETYDQTCDGDPERVARDLVNAAIAAGGTDNISVIFVPGPGFQGRNSASAGKARARMAATRVRRRVRGRSWRRNWRGVAASVFLLALGAVAGAFASRAWYRPIAAPLAPPTPRHYIADADPSGIARALRAAHQGDTIEVPPGEFAGPVLLRDDVTLIAARSGEAVIHADPGAAGENAIAVIAQGIHGGRISGFHIAGMGTSTTPLDCSASDSLLHFLFSVVCPLFLQLHG